MKHKFCPLCGDRLTKANETKDHVIPNAIGGWLKVKDFICKSCNDISGRKWDHAISEQTALIASMLGVVREEGVTPALNIKTVSGEKLKLREDGVMHFEARNVTQEVIGEDQIKLSLRAKSIEDAKTILKGLKKKYPKLDIDKILDGAEVQSDYLEEPLHTTFSFGGNAVSHSAVKTALAFAFKYGVSAPSCRKALHFLKDKNAPNINDFFYHRDVVLNRTNGQIFHCVAIEAEPKRKLLMAYVEYFGFFRYGMVLNKNYKGGEFRGVYAVDPRTGEEVGLKINLNFTRLEIQTMKTGHTSYFPTMIEALESIIPVVMQASDDREANRVILFAREIAFASIGLSLDQTPTAEQAELMMPVFKKNMEKYLIKIVSKAMGTPMQELTQKLAEKGIH